MTCPFEMAPFLGDIRIFWGANCYSSGIHLLPQTEGFLKLLHPRSLRQFVPEKWWLGDKPVLLGRLYNFSGSKLYSCRECTIQVHRCSIQVPMHVPNFCTMVCHKRFLEYQNADSLLTDYGFPKAMSGGTNAT